jgi:hypothetical protein
VLARYCGLLIVTLTFNQKLNKLETCQAICRAS